jgi:hypothetical protein
VNDDQLREAYAGYLARPRDASRTACAGPDALLAVVERSGPEQTRLATLDHAMSCEACRRDLELLRSIAVASAPRRRALVGLRAAAGIALLVLGGALTWLVVKPEPATVLRGDADVVLVAPVGETASPVRLTWRGVRGASMYRAEVLSATGDSVFAERTADTTVVLPPGRLSGGRDYLWSVRAERPDGTHARAVPLRFRLRE